MSGGVLCEGDGVLADESVVDHGSEASDATTQASGKRKREDANGGSPRKKSK